MKINTILALVLTLVFAGCGRVSKDNSTVAESSPLAHLQSGAYALVGAILNGTYVVESHLVAEATGYSVFHQCNGNQLCRIKRADVSTSSTSAPILPGVCRFPYFFKYSGTHYLTCGVSHGAGDVYMWSSPDLETWSKANNGQPILRQTPGTNWAHIWNVAVLPVGTRWHMLAETSATLDRMDLAYSYADVGGGY